MSGGRTPGPIVLLANGNLNGRSIRLIADHLHSSHHLPVRLVSTGELLRWPEERSRPHVVEATPVEEAEAQRLVARASAYVFAATFDPTANSMVTVARRSGTPSFCMVADIGYGVRRLDPTDHSGLPDRIGVGDPITSRLLKDHGVPKSIIRHVGSPYLDTVLATRAPQRPDSRELRVGLLLNPESIEARRSGYSEEDVFRETREVLRSLRKSRLTVRPTRAWKSPGSTRRWRRSTPPSSSRRIPRQWQSSSLRIT